MNLVIKFFGTIVGLVTFSQISHGSLLNDNAETGDSEVLKATSLCAELVSLNEKENLSEEEWSRGNLLNNLIEQVSINPIDYCSFTLARSSIHEEGDGEAIESL